MVLKCTTDRASWVTHSSKQMFASLTVSCNQIMRLKQRHKQTLENVTINRQQLVKTQVAGLDRLPGGSTQRGCICVDSSSEKPCSPPASQIDLHLKTQNGESTPALREV